MKVINKSISYNHSWDLLVQMYLSRYPTTPFFTSLLDHEISKIHWDKNKQLFYCEKRTSMYVPVPKTLQKISKVDHCYVFQNLTIDIPNKIMKECTWNRKDTKRYTMDEVATWEGINEHTEFKETAKITISKIIPTAISNIVLKKVEKRYNAGYNTAREVDNVLISKCLENNISPIESIQNFCDRQFQRQNIHMKLNFDTAFVHCFTISERSGKYI
ncbi:PRELI/MSF1 domain-containing protein [Entamoeba marina]